MYWAVLAVTREAVFAKEASKIFTGNATFDVTESNFSMSQFLLSKANIVCLSTAEYSSPLIVIKQFKILECKVLKMTSDIISLIS